MKTLIRKEIAREKNREKPDEHYIKKLRRLLKLPTITIEQWIDTGRFVTREDFVYYNREVKLHKDCSDVVKYAGGFFIQAIKTGGYFVDEEAAKKVSLFDTLDEAERYLWDTKVAQSL